MSKKRKNLNSKDIIAIFEIIKRQRYLGVTEDKELDPDGKFAFANEVACRNIKENIHQLLIKVMHEDDVPYEATQYDELSRQGVENYRKENKSSFPVEQFFNEV